MGTTGHKRKSHTQLWPKHKRGVFYIHHTRATMSSLFSTVIGFSSQATSGGINTSRRSSESLGLVYVPRRWRPFCSQIELSIWFVGRKKLEPPCLSFISVATAVSYDLWNACLTRYVSVFLIILR